MKINTILLLILCLYVTTAQAQRCGTATAVITSRSHTGVPGLSPNFMTAACIDSGTFVNDTLYFENYATIGGTSVVYLRFDSINNLPAGLCWESNLIYDTLRGGYTGAIYIRGTCTAPTGQYKLKFIVDILSGNFIDSWYSADADTIPGLHVPLRYYLNVRAPGGPCPAIDTGDLAVAALSVSGHQTLCPHHSISVSASLGTGFRYLWSNGDTTRTVLLSSPGSYRVTVTGRAGSTAVSDSLVVNLDSLRAYFVLVPDTAPHQWRAIDESTISIPFLLSRVWDWGDGSSNIYFHGYNHDIHTYDSAGYYTVCMHITDSWRCTDVYCDSSVYLSKTDAQMVSTVLVDQPGLSTGLDNVGVQQVKVYPNPATESLIVESGSQVPGRAVIYDASGRTIREINLSSGKSSVDVSGLPVGAYTLSFGDNTMHPVRFVLSK
jgi:hypothetical protein